jgi:hypothetical protein
VTESPGHRPGVFVLRPVGAGGVEVVGGQDLFGSAPDDGDGEGFLAAVGGADAEVAHPGGVADADLAARVDVVVRRRADAEGLATRPLCARPTRYAACSPPYGPMRSAARQATSWSEQKPD